MHRRPDGTRIRFRGARCCSGPLGSTGGGEVRARETWPGASRDLTGEAFPCTGSTELDAGVLYVPANVFRCVLKRDLGVQGCVLAGRSIPAIFTQEALAEQR